MEHLPTPLFCLTLSHSIDDRDTVERLLAEYPQETQHCIPIALRSILATKDLPPVPFFSAQELLNYLSVLWSNDWAIHKFNVAARDGLTYLVSYFINRGISRNALLDVLRAAPEGGHVNIMKLLLDKGANIHMWNDHAIKAAAERGHTGMVKLLLDRGANIHTDKDAPLRQAIHEHHIDTAQLLIERKADVHVEDDMPIALASQYDDIDMIELLLSYGANIHAGNNEILQYTESNPRRKLAQFLREKGLI